MSLRATVLAVLVLAGCAGQPFGPGADIAADAAGSDIYLVTVLRADGALTLGPPRNLTDRRGYDNQPYFLPDDSGILYASIRRGRQADIYRYDLAEGRHTRITSTPESEFSPRQIPDSSRMSVVRVEEDGTQRLWSFAADGGTAAIVAPTLSGVGYHAWFDRDTVGVYVIGEPNQLRIIDLDTGRDRTAAENVGASLQKLPNRAMVGYIDLDDADQPWVKAVETSGLMRPLTPVAEGGEHPLFAADGNLFMSAGRTIYLWERRPGAWRALATFDDLPGPITRLATNSDASLIAMVVAEEDGP